MRIITNFLICSLFLCSLSAFAAKSRKRPAAKIIADWSVVVAPVQNAEKSSVGYVEVFPYGDKLNPAKFAVVSFNGMRLPAKILWNAPGVPMKILFATIPSSKTYSILFGKRIPVWKTKWTPKAGLIMETKSRAKGNVNNWKDAEKIIKLSKKVQGRGIVDNIFQATNPFGPTRDIVIHYTGYFNIPKSGEYKFAIAADDAVFLFLDARQVAKWPKWHGPWDGVRGKYSGKIVLKKGIRRIDYYNIQNSYGLRLVCGWQPPGAKYLKVIPPEAFVPLRRFKVEKLRYKGKNIASYFSWTKESHLMTHGKAIVNMRFKVVEPVKNVEYRWIFDDSAMASGREVVHTFYSTGSRKVILRVFANGRKVAEIANMVDVSPCWSQREEWPTRLYAEMRKKLEKVDYAKLPPRDIRNVVDILGIIDERPLLAKIGQACLKRAPEFASSPELFALLADCYIHYSIRRYDLAEKSYELVLKYAGSDKKLAAETLLDQAALKIRNFGQCDAGLKILNGVDTKLLSSRDRRRRLICMADAYMTKGDSILVDKIYAELPAAIDKNKKKNAILKEARILNALDYLKNGAYDDAEKMVRQVEWDYPEEAVKSHTGLILTKVFIKRKEYNYALFRCMRMMNAARDSTRMPEIMLTLVEIYQLTGHAKEAAALSVKLSKDYPYSRAAAILKEKR